MKAEVIFGIFVVVLIYTSEASECSEASKCPGNRPLGSKCTDSIDCNSRYCRGGECVEYEQVADEKGRKNSCKPSPCAVGEVCTHKQVQCIRFPCPSLVDCVSVNHCY